MSKIHRSRPAISAFAAVLMLAVSDSIAVHGREEDLLRAPVPAASWDERSGYGAVEAIRATIGRPAASTTDQAYRVLAAADASGDEAPAPTAAELLAQFRAIDLAPSRNLGAEQQLTSCASAS